MVSKRSTNFSLIKIKNTTLLQRKRRFIKIVNTRLNFTKSRLKLRILNFCKHTLIINFSLSKTSLSLSSRSLSFGKRNTSAKGLGLKIAKRIDSQTVGISTGGLSKIALNTRPNFLKKSLTLSKVSFSKGLSEFCVDFIEFHTESLRQSVGFRCGLRKLEQRILINLALSFSKSFNTLSIFQSNISVNRLKLFSHLSHFKKRRSTRLKSRHRIILIRTRAGNISTLSGLSRPRINLSRLNGRTFNKRINTGSGVGSTLSSRRIVITIGPIGQLLLTIKLHFSISTTISNLLLIHLFLPFAILTVKLALSNSRTSTSSSSKSSSTSHNSSSYGHRLINLMIAKNRC